MSCLHLVPPNNLRVCSKCGLVLCGRALSEARIRRALADKEEERQARLIANAKEPTQSDLNAAPQRRRSARHRMHSLILAGLALSIGGVAGARDE